MIAALIVVAVGVSTLAASYLMWRATARSGLWSLIAGAVLAIVAFFCAVAIGVIMTRAWFG